MKKNRNFSGDRMSGVDYFDLIVIIPLEEELKEFFKIFPYKRNLTFDNIVMYEVEAPNNLKVLVVLQQKQGIWGANEAATYALSEYHCSLIVCMGIAGALSKDLKIGDVCYSGTIIDVTDNGKITDVKITGEAPLGEHLQLYPDFLHTPRQITGPLNFMRVMPEWSQNYASWQSECLERDPCYKEVHQFSPPDSIDGDIACGSVSESASYKTKLKNIQRKILAIETESGGVFRAAELKSVPAIAIRGISDFADTDKGELEDATAGAARRFSASNAASFLRMQLDHNIFFDQWLCQARPSNLSLPNAGCSEIDNLNAHAYNEGALLEEALSFAEERLGELSAAYKTKPDGYLLPLPRIRSLSRLKERVKFWVDDKIEIRDALRLNANLLLEVPRTFPDKSLPWLIAQHSCYSVDNDRLIIPIVIDGEMISPPSRNLLKLSYIDFSSVLDRTDIKILFIIENFDYKSKTKLKFLERELEKYQDHGFLFLDSSDTSLREVEDFCSLLSLEQYSLLEISFMELSAFLTRHYSFQNSAAEVIARRLDSLFNRFGMRAHPTYFAGIPEELLNALLTANRRAELMQLAVDGYLTFVVADDKTSNSLSRSTREKFLSLLAVEINVEKQSLSETDLIGFTDKFLDDRGFPISSDDFLAGFFDKAILIKHDSRIVFGLPFVESYVLAKHLSNNESVASAYFNINDDKFDLRTFDLYSEMSDRNPIADKVIDSMALFAESNKNWQKAAKLLDASFQPALIKDKKHIRALRERLDLALKAVASGASRSTEKQALIDVADRVNEEVSSQHEQDVEHKPSRTREINKLDLAIQIWAIGTVLLGQGCERLEKNKKTRLAALLVENGAFLIDSWTNQRSKLDFEALKRKLSTEKDISRIVGTAEMGETSLSQKEIIDGLIDLVEMAFICEPTHAMIDYLTREASHSILSSTVQSISTDGELTNYVSTAWLASISVSLAASRMSDLPKNIGYLPLLRTIIASGAMRHAYWDTPEQNSQLQLLNFANDILKPLGRRIDIGKAKREIKAKKKTESQAE